MMSTQPDSTGAYATAGKINGRLSQPKTGGQEDRVVVGDPLEISLKGIVLEGFN